MSNEEKPSRVARPRRRGAGSIFQKEANGPWVIQYYKDDPAQPGKRIQVREYTGLKSRTAAQDTLNERLVAVNRGEVFETRQARAVTIADLYDALEVHVQNHSRDKRGMEGLEWRWAHLKPAFGHVRAANLTTDAVEMIEAARERARAEAENNKFLGILKSGPVAEEPEEPRVQ